MAINDSIIDGRHKEMMQLTESMRNDLHERRDNLKNQEGHMVSELEDIRDAIQVINDFLGENQEAQSLDLR